MNTMRHPALGPEWLRLAALAVIVAAVLAAAWFVGDAFERGKVAQPVLQVPAVGAPAQIAVSTGRMGELRRFEAAQVAPAKASMGELRRFEAVQTMTAKVGIGELRRFEAAQTSRTGIGELRRFEARQVTSARVGMGELRRFESTYRFE